MSQERASLEDKVAQTVADRLGFDASIVKRVQALLDERVPIPYLARYRREAVGGLEEAELRQIAHTARDARELEQRRARILAGLAERDDVPSKLRSRIERCRNRIELEYLYEPFRPPRKTPGSLARERGLEPLADALLEGKGPPAETAAPFVDAGKGVASAEDALQGAREILAERFAALPEFRMALYRAISKEGVLRTAPAPGKTTIPDRYKQLKSYEEKLARIPSHRFLAVRRAAKEGAVQEELEFPEEKALAGIADRHFPKECPDETRAFLDEAARDALRLAARAVQADVLETVKRRADDEAIEVFQRNLRDLLLFPPAGPRRVLALDPAPRGTVPVACVDEHGQHLENAKIRPFDKDEKKAESARAVVADLCRKHRVEIVALGNGGGRHPCENFLRDALAELGDDEPPVVVVNEVGLGSYASSPAARAEMPALPVPVRGVVSLARRLMDPLSELVKLAPKQIGVGQYQSDVDPDRLSKALEEVVEHCVNLVGVDVNRAAMRHLAHVCGVTNAAARTIVEHRERAGRFPTLLSLRDLPVVTDEAFEQSAGFLRVEGGENPLDATGVHPRDYPVVDRIAAAVGVVPADLVGNTDAVGRVVAEEIADEQHSAASVAGVLSELLEGGRDPRPPLEVVRRPPGVRSVDDLRAGMTLSGRVTNVTNFGAFVDVGAQQDGLVHVSELADRFVRDPTTVVRVGQVVQVKVLGVEKENGRISLTMKSGRGGDGRRGRGRDGRRGGRDRDRGRGRGRRDRRDRQEQAPPAPEPTTEPAAAAAAEPEDPVPADMTEQEFMQKKLDELRKRFG